MTPAELEPIISETKEGVMLACWVQPKSSRDAVAGIHGDSLKVAITAPPVDGKANAHLCKYIAKLAGIPKSSVDIASGHASRRKVLSLRDIDKKTLAGIICRA